MTAAHDPTRWRRGLRLAIQALVVVLGWAGFGWLWMLVAQRPWESGRLAWLIGGSAVLLPLVTLAWVMHNRSLYRRKGERRGVLRAVPAYTHDWHGRSVEADWPALRQCQVVTIGVADGRKRYHGRTPVTPQSRRAPPQDFRWPPRSPVVPSGGTPVAPDLLATGAEQAG